MKTKYILFTIIFSFVLGLKGWGQGYTISNTSPTVVYGNKLSDDLTITANFTGTGTIEDPNGSIDNISSVSNGLNIVTNNNIISDGIYTFRGIKSNGGSVGSMPVYVSLSPRMIKVDPIAPGFIVEKEYDGTTDGVCDADEITEGDKIYKKVLDRN